MSAMTIHCRCVSTINSLSLKQSLRAPYILQDISLAIFIGFQNADWYGDEMKQNI